MSKIYVVGGKQKQDALSQSEWHAHEKGVIVAVDTSSGHTEMCCEYVSPPEVCIDNNPSILFKAASQRGNRLYACTQTEIVVFSIPGFKQVGYVSLPLFNDIHHVTVRENGHYLIANTGLDMVLEITPEGTVVKEWGVLGHDPWSRFDRYIDYRKVPTTKPHASHPNYVFEYDNEIWATRFEQRDAICLTKSNLTMQIEIERPHDGIVYGGDIFFTTVDGHVVVVDGETRVRKEIYDLGHTVGGIRLPAWCRGLAVVDERYLLVGFSRLRPTKWTDNIKWLGNRNVAIAKLQRPATVVLYDRVMRRIVREFNVENVGLNAIFSIHAPHGIDLRSL